MRILADERTLGKYSAIVDLVRLNFEDDSKEKTIAKITHLLTDGNIGLTKFIYIDGNGEKRIAQTYPAESCILDSVEIDLFRQMISNAVDSDLEC